MRALELFAGTGSFRKMAEPRYEVISVDLDPTFNPDLCMSVLDIPLDMWPEGYFDVIWASPPCTQFSKAKTMGERDLEGADALVLHTLTLIRVLKPKYWFLENPASGLLKARSFMRDLPYADVTYCRYAPDWGYRKATRIWTNADVWTPRPICAKDCAAMVRSACGWRHRCTAQRGPSYPGDKSWSQYELYRVPPALIQEILEAITASSASSS